MTINIPKCIDVRVPANYTAIRAEEGRPVTAFDPFYDRDIVLCSSGGNGETIGIRQLGRNDLFGVGFLTLEEYVGLQKALLWVEKDFTSAVLSGKYKLPKGRSPRKKIGFLENMVEKSGKLVMPNIYRPVLSGQGEIVSSYRLFHKIDIVLVENNLANPSPGMRVTAHRVNKLGMGVELMTIDEFVTAQEELADNASIIAEIALEKFAKAKDVPAYYVKYSETLLKLLDGH